MGKVYSRNISEQRLGANVAVARHSYISRTCRKLRGSAAFSPTSTVRKWYFSTELPMVFPKSPFTYEDYLGFPHYVGFSDYMSYYERFDQLPGRYNRFKISAERESRPNTVIDEDRARWTPMGSRPPIRAHVLVVV